MAGKGIIRIYYKDSSYKSFYLHEDITAKEVAELFGSDFLHVEKKVAAHFSIHVVIDGKDIRQLKPEDRPLRVQRDLFSLKISWNTDKNYFLFCLSDEAKVRLTAKMGASPEGSPKSKKGSELIMPGRLSSQSSPDRPNRPLSRKMSLRPKLFFNRGKSETKIRPPVPNSRSESELDADKRAPFLDKDRRSLTVGGLSGEPVSSKTKQEISDNLRRMVMEEKKKLASSTSSDKLTPTEKQSTSTEKQPSTVAKVVGPSTPPLPRTTARSTPPQHDKTIVDIIDDIQTTSPVAKRSPVINKKEDVRGGNGSIQNGATDDKKKPLPGALKATSSPNTKKENEEISNMFDSIFDWYPSKQGGETPASPPRSDSPTTFVHGGGDVVVEEDEDIDMAFDQAFDDILGALNKLKETN